MNSWQNKFETHILKRGMEYCEKGRVGQVEETGFGFSAPVYGSEEYDVRIYVENDEVVAMTCTCPYAEDGENCKHMAAVLTAISRGEEGWPASEVRKKPVISLEKEREKRQEEFFREEPIDVSVSMLLESADRDELELFLSSEMEVDESLARRFKIFMTDIVESSETDMYREQLKDIFDGCKGRHGYISYYMAEELEDELHRFIDDVIYDTMLRYGKETEAFMLAAALVEEFSRIEIDDSGGITVEITWHCAQIIEEIIGNGSDILKARIFDWLENLVQRDDVYPIEDVVERLWCGSFTEPIFLERRKAVALRKLEQYGKNAGKSEEYRLSRWLDIYFEAADGLDTSEEAAEEVEKIERKHWKTPKARMHAVERLTFMGQMAEGIDILEKSKTMDKSYPGLVKDYSQRLVRLYEITGDEKKRKEELICLITKHNKCDLDAFKELKKICDTEEWESVRKGIFDAVGKCRGADRLFNEEKMYDRLTEYIVKSKDLSLIDEYRQVLESRCPEAILEMYRAAILKEAEHSGTRSHYRNIVKLMRKMRKFDGGIAAVLALEKELREKYKQRPAMMDEMDKL